jgi:hypothetical protein
MHSRRRPLSCHAIRLRHQSQRFVVTVHHADPKTKLSMANVAAMSFDGAVQIPESDEVLNLPRSATLQMSLRGL